MLIVKKTDGTLWSVGYNTSGQLGLGDFDNRNTLIKINNYGWKSVSIGNGSVLAIRNDDTLWSWGNGINGILGLGDTNNRNMPTQITTDKWFKASINVASFYLK